MFPQELKFISIRCVQQDQTVYYATQTLCPILRSTKCDQWHSCLLCLAVVCFLTATESSIPTFNWPFFLFIYCVDFSYCWLNLEG